MAGTLFGYGIFDVHGFGNGIGFDVRNDGFGIEEPELSQFAYATDDIFFTEQISGACVEFAVYDVVVRDGIPFDIYFAYGGLFVFMYANFHENGIVFHTGFHRGHTGEHIAVVHIQAHDVFGIRGAVSRSAFVEELGVIDIAFL